MCKHLRNGNFFPEMFMIFASTQLRFLHNLPNTQCLVYESAGEVSERNSSIPIGFKFQFGVDLHGI